MASDSRVGDTIHRAQKDPVTGVTTVITLSGLFDENHRSFVQYGQGDVVFDIYMLFVWWCRLKMCLTEGVSPSPLLRVRKWTSEEVDLVCTEKELQCFLLFAAEHIGFSPDTRAEWLTTCVASVTTHKTVPVDAFCVEKWPQAPDPPATDAQLARAERMAHETDKREADLKKREAMYAAMVRDGGGDTESDDSETKRERKYGWDGAHSPRNGKKMRV